MAADALIDACVQSSCVVSVTILGGSRQDAYSNLCEHLSKDASIIYLSGDAEAWDDPAKPCSVLLVCDDKADMAQHTARLQ